MYAISNLYTEYLQRRSREWLVKVNIAGTDYGSDVIVDFVVENDMSGEQEFELGTAILSKLILRIKTDVVIPPNARVVPYVAIQSPADQDGVNAAWNTANVSWQDANFPWMGMTEWMPLGEFYIDQRKQVKDVWVFTCYDRLVWADVPYVSQLAYPTTQKAVWDEICNRLGYTYDNSVVINSGYMIQAGPAGYSMRQVLAYIASANAACLYISKDGILRFRRFGATDLPVMSLTKSDYISVKQLNPVKEYTRIVVTYNTEDGLTYAAGAGDENHTLYVENPFATQAITNDLYNRLNGFRYMPVDMDARGYPQIEAGDRIRFGQPVDSPTWNTADIAWQDADFSWDGFADGSVTAALNQVFTFKGGLKLALNSPSKSEQKSEFVVDGTLSQQVNKLNKNAVREGRSYFGATLTRTDGLTIEREDHASKVILNSDKMAFQAGGVDKLYFDPVAGKYKFVGDIVMQGGSISWEGVGGPDYTNITGTKPPSNADNTNNTIGIDRLTKITPTGVYTGTVETGQLIAGGALISTAMIENLVVGSNVVMGPSATISWGNVTSQPFIPSTAADVGALATSSPMLTYIGPTGIYTGTVTTNQLIAGSAKISTALIDNLVVGSNVTMGPSATISWGNVTSQPFIPSTAADVGALASNSPMLTYIGPTGIYTGTLTAAQVNAVAINASSITTGTLTGVIIQGTTFKTAAAGRRIEISSANGLESFSASGSHDGPSLFTGSSGFAGQFYYHRNGSPWLRIGDPEGSSTGSQVGISNFTNMIIGNSSYSVECRGPWTFKDVESINFTLSTTTSASAGGASTLPTTPEGYLQVLINGSLRSIPFYR